MTRQEEIQRAAEEYATGSPNATLRHKAFIDGAGYADKHPNWHSVEENPIKQDTYLVRVEVDVYGITPPRKITKYELAPYAECEGIMKWHTLGFTYPNSRITHWMEIPAVEPNIGYHAKKQTDTIDAWVARDKDVFLYMKINLTEKKIYGMEVII